MVQNRVYFFRKTYSLDIRLHFCHQELLFYETHPLVYSLMLIDILKNNCFLCRNEETVHPSYCSIVPLLYNIYNHYRERFLTNRNIIEHFEKLSDIFASNIKGATRTSASHHSPSSRYLSVHRFYRLLKFLMEQPCVPNFFERLS